MHKHDANHGAAVEQGLEPVKTQAAERRGGHAVMMHGMHMTKEKWPMQQPMAGEEIKFIPKREKQNITQGLPRCEIFPVDSD